ncbi:thioredoxin domain-containing protein [Mammaliicoccus lentus]|uniref:thioredoxin domain-containing protein n=1 Tax=Mammaliicoccus lentus TaxID=42858 RepID=UPI0002EAB160|nr:thioredoxin domain-containing protein [Mammaliicoccus lentus]MEB5686524.1 DsbA family protein [Mammaliicoccus lentus]WQL56334.1 thioredoxin domain-containing protein [Mammaliicoccus lentus]
MTELQHLTFGKEDANITVEAFINFACPYCKHYFFAADEVLTPYIENGDVKYIVKHFDKTKQHLLKGTVANIHLDYDDPDEAIKYIRDLYETQEEWTVSFETIERKMEDELRLAPQKHADDRSLAINRETFERDITGIPTVFINGERFDFDPVEDNQKTIQEKLEKALLN